MPDPRCDAASKLINGSCAIDRCCVPMRTTHDTIAIFGNALRSKNAEKGKKYSSDSKSMIGLLGCKSEEQGLVV